MIICYYHGNCPDGFTAAWVVYTYFKSGDVYNDIKFFPMQYGNLPDFELIKNQDVYIVDFSFPRDVTLKLLELTQTLTIFDHHITAQKDLTDLPVREYDRVVFDMKRSGAGITWDSLFDCERPWLIDYVEDRDLWTFKLPNSREISLYIRCTPYTFENWDKLYESLHKDVLDLSEGVQYYLDHYINNVIQFIYPLIISYANDGDIVVNKVEVLAVNITYTGVSDVLNDILLNSNVVDVALGWFADPSNNIIRCSLRSKKDFDCSEIAKAFGGGGHKQAAGFTLPLSNIHYMYKGISN